MLSYKEDSTLPHQVITLFNGEKEYRSLCTKIKGEYYVKERDCFEVEERWYRVDSGLILKDYETKEWFLKNRADNRHYGIVEFKNNVPIIGYYTFNPYNNVKVSSIEHYGTAINANILLENGYIEELSSGTYVCKRDLNSSGIRNSTMIYNKLNHGHKGYNIEDNIEEAALKRQYYLDYKTPSPTNTIRYSRFLNDVTFGLELECSHGFLPENIQNRTGVVICHDGSLKDENGIPGPEFTTVPLFGAKGLQNIVYLTNELKKRTLLNTKCSLHLHLGNLPTSRLFIVSLYVLAYKIQDEIFKMFPYYKTDYEIAGKEKDYCQKLAKMNMGIMNPSSKEEYDKYINDNYIKLFYWLSKDMKGGGFMPSKEWSRKNKSHPVDHKWNRKNRYYWMNLMNTMFSERNTVEFRIHTPTVNSQKIINWLFICNAIVRYAIVHSREILTNGKKISLSTILDYYKDTFKITQAEFLSDYLKAYVKERTDAFQKDYVKRDFLSTWELEGDKDYVFTYNGTTNLF